MNDSNVLYCLGVLRNNKWALLREYSNDFSEVHWTFNTDDARAYFTIHDELISLKNKICANGEASLLAVTIHSPDVFTFEKIEDPTDY